MKKRTLGKTGFEITEISLGTWQVGGKWGAPFSHQNADEVLNTAVDQGINFIDTADVYGDGESEKAVGRLVRSRSERIYVASKCGQAIRPQLDASYQPDVLRKFVEDSLKRMQLDTLDLIQLHCPPTATFYRPEIFELFDRLKDEGKIQFFGVSVETVDEAFKALEYDNVTTVQIIFNMLRQRPSEAFFATAAQKNIGILARVPLASGLLSGAYTSGMSFGADDHRTFNRNGEAFDKGETFSGIDFEKGLAVVERLKALFPEYESLATVALRWILNFEEVSCVIPGASRAEQVLWNLKAAELPPLSAEQMKAVRQVYEEDVWPDLSKERW